VNLPPSTTAALNADHPEGSRHRAKVELCLQLLGNGIPPAAVEVTLEQKFPQSAKGECASIVKWCQSKNPTPSSSRTPRNASMIPYTPLDRKMNAKDAAKAFLNGGKAPSAKSIEENNAIAIFKALYKPDEYVNVVCKYTTTEKNGKVKANPMGAGANKTVQEWIEYIEKEGIPQSNAGAWMRPNPVKKVGSGHDGAITNDDITAFRFLLLESDELDTDQQLAIYAKLNIPIAAILSSGGKSCHAWLRLDATDADDYAAKTARIYAALEQFGFDKANKNPSRLSRLPGAVRKIGGTGDGVQRLMSVHPEVVGITDDQIARLESAVKLPKYQPVNFKQALETAIDIYEDIHKNKGRTGLYTGFQHFDTLTGGLKPGWFIVVAGATNAGKTSFVLNIVNNALRDGKSVALFSFEMDMQEIIDILFAQNANVNRNAFNNGYFSKDDFSNMGKAIPSLQKYKIHTFDDPMMTIADVMESCEYIKAGEHGLDLVVIDYLQLANTDDNSNGREQQVAGISRGSKRLAKRIKCPVIGVSQLNEDGKVRESRGIAHDANCVINVSVPNPDEPTIVEARVEKGRSIPKGLFNFNFNPVLCLFEDNGCEDSLMKMMPQEHDTHDWTHKL